MADLSPIAAELAKLVPLLSSDKDGEVVAAVRAIKRKLDKAGGDFHDLALAITSSKRPDEEGKKPPAAVVMAEALCAVIDTIPPRHHEFVKQMRASTVFEYGLSEKQEKYLTDLYTRYCYKW